MTTPAKAAELVRKNLRLLLDRLGWSQVTLSEKTNISPQHLNFYLTGKRAPRLETLEQLAGGLGVSMSTLLTDGESSDAEREIVQFAEILHSNPDRVPLFRAIMSDSEQSALIRELIVILADADPRTIRMLIGSAKAVGPARR